MLGFGLGRTCQQMLRTNVVRCVRQVRRIYRAIHGSQFQQQSGQRIVQCNPSDQHGNSTVSSQRLMRLGATPIYSP